MAKVPFSKLNLKVNNNIVPVNIGTTTVGVKQYLPLENKFKLIATVLQNAYDVENNFSNPLKQQACFFLELINYYTDIVFTDKQKENIAELYDKLVSSGAMETITEAIPAEEYKRLSDALEITCNAFYNYRTSALGILDSIQADYSEMDLDAQKIKDKFSDPEMAATIKELMNKLS